MTLKLKARKLRLVATYLWANKTVAINQQKVLLAHSENRLMQSDFMSLITLSNFNNYAINVYAHQMIIYVGDKSQSWGEEKWFNGANIVLLSPLFLSLFHSK